MARHLEKQGDLLSATRQLSDFFLQRQEEDEDKRDTAVSDIQATFEEERENPSCDLTRSLIKKHNEIQKYIEQKDNEVPTSNEELKYLAQKALGFPDAKKEQEGIKNWVSIITSSAGQTVQDRFGQEWVIGKKYPDFHGRYFLGSPEGPNILYWMDDDLNRYKINLYGANIDAFREAAQRSQHWVPLGNAVNMAAPLVFGAAVVGAGGAAGTIRWLFSGTRLIAGGTSAAANLATQAMEHGAEWERYNWGSVGFDYIMGVISYSVAKSVINQWPAPLFSKQIVKLQTWKNFGKQQAVLALYGTIVGAIRAQVSNTQTDATVGAQHTEGLLQMGKSIGLQSFLASSTGKRLFPAGVADPRIVFISRLLTFITKLAVREVFDVAPHSTQGQSSVR
ncbi:MAG: hypothetical protein QTN59_04280 [Candidatus Electrothrix communis]|nr:MAG: hypothetical protein QTN59_04280 [Candidatus Electrothrix communis]